MRRLLTLAGSLVLALVLGLRATHARADARRRVPVRVVDVSGGYAYLSAGSAKGLRVGTRVRFGSVERRVEKTSRSYAIVSARRLRVGALGVAESLVGDEVTRLSTPRPLSAFVGKWPEAVRPADRQRPAHVPLGRMQARGGDVDATLSASGAAIVPLGGAVEAMARAELRARVRVLPVPSWPLSVQGDVALQRWFGRFATGVATGDARPLLRVRELSLAIGHHDGYRAELGRLRYAAASLGPIDGGRFEAARWGALRIAGFGGVLPDPIAGRAELEAGRFGVELGLSGDELAMRPALTLVGSASVFGGRIDERRVHLDAQLSPDDHRVGAYAEGAAFDEDNPWQRPAFDLTAAGADVDLRFATLRLGARFDMRKPERSYWLARAFPASWLCASASALEASGACSGGDDTRYTAQGSVGLALGRAQLDAGAAWIGSSDGALGSHALGHASVRLVRLAERYDLALGGSHESGTLLKASSSVRAEVGLSALDERMHLRVYYRPARRLYQASAAAFWEQGGGASLHVVPTPALSLDLHGDVRIGDVDVGIVMLTVAYRMGL